MQKSSKSLKVKVLMLGESGVGKTSILSRFVDNQFKINYTVTLGVDYKLKQIKIDQKEVEISIWDTAGQDQYRTITPIYYKNVDGVVVVYDITDEKSYQNVNYWMENLSQFADPKIVCALVGNKLDMADKRAVAKEKGEEMKEQNNIFTFCETSAKAEHNNVNELFINLTKEILRRRDQGIGVEYQNGQKLQSNSNASSKKKEGKCCGNGESKKNK